MQFCCTLIYGQSCIIQKRLVGCTHCDPILTNHYLLNDRACANFWVTLQNPATKVIGQCRVCFEIWSLADRHRFLNWSLRLQIRGSLQCVDLILEL
jgi:hypothetical protein